MRTTTMSVAAAAVVMALTLAGCSGGDDSAGDAGTRTSTPVTSAPAASATPTASSSSGTSAAAHTDAELTSVFQRIQFKPAEFSSTDAMLDSVYPGLTVSDASCLAPFGVGWEKSDDAGAVVFGTSNDRSMTAVVASTGDSAAATTLVGDARDALSRCADGTALFSMQGKPVETTVETTKPTLTGTDEALGWRVRGTVGGNPFTLVGLTARVDGDVVALVGWDQASNTTNVPLATQMFVDAL
ncbi:hypothetical protein DEJ33_11650 [Curtobacterium sp. MCPF17_047]|uniref:hypothetical protein n=1 Tax=Curtobacterium sp. MCPF17_047 TaxID=2175654 RepID=UPI000DAA55F0|nr:hypothetical protein [Curtobacterium sp. MCPF17_047]PZF64653.1 hypothetical protein DEJ33_11650 [Curtobacterium sp. MCPF17_047]